MHKQEATSCTNKKNEPTKHLIFKIDRMKKISFLAIFMVVLLLGFNSISLGQVLLNENFDYPAGDLITAHGWAAHSGPGSQAITVGTPGLTFPGYIGSGIGNCALADNTGEDDNKTFTTQTSGVVYTSFMVKVNSAITAAGYFYHFSVNPINTTFRGKVFIDATNHFGVSVGSNTGTYAASTFTVGTTYLIVVKYEIVAGTSNDKVSLFVFNASVPVSEPVATIGPLTEATSDINPGSVAIRQFVNTENISIDGIRVATTWAELLPVVPQPIPTMSEWGLIFLFIALSAVGAVYILRRKNSEVSI